MLASPRTGMVERGSSWSQVVQVAPITHMSWSLWPSGWQLAQAKVPLEEPAAVLKAMRPSRTASGVGSSPTGTVATAESAPPGPTSTTLTLLPRVFSTYAVPVAKPSGESKATPRGMSPTSSVSSTPPGPRAAVSTVAIRLEAAAVTTSSESSPEIATP